MMRKVLTVLYVMFVLLCLSTSSSCLAYKITEKDPIITSKLVYVGNFDDRDWYLNCSKVEFVNILSKEVGFTGIQFEAYVTGKDFKEAFTYILATDKDNNTYLKPIFITSFNITPTSVEAEKTYSDNVPWIPVHNNSTFAKLIDTLNQGVSNGEIKIE